jgi:hypothetical protein
MGVSEARRLLPRLVRTIATEGGRVDVTLRGRPQVSIVRTADMVGKGAGGHRASPSDALRVEFVIPPRALVDAIRGLRRRVGRPRAMDGGSHERGGRRTRPRA